MDPLLQRRVQRYGWDKAANYYELYWQRQLEPARRKLLEMAALNPGEWVLDIACGTGRLTVQFAEIVGPEGEIFGTDISDNMIEIANRTVIEKNIRNIKFERMEAEELQIDDATYDVAICSLGLMYVTDSAKATNEMYRVLKPGGRAVASVWGQRRNCGWADIFPIVESRVKSEVCPLFFQLGAGNTLESVFKEVGFVNVRSERIRDVLQYRSSEEACGAAFAGGPVALAYSRFDDKTKKEAHVEYLKSIESFKNEGGHSIPAEFLVVTGHKAAGA